MTEYYKTNYYTLALIFQLVLVLAEYSTRN